MVNKVSQETQAQLDRIEHQKKLECLQAQERLIVQQEQIQEMTAQAQQVTGFPGQIFHTPIGSNPTMAQQSHAATERAGRLHRVKVASTALKIARLSDKARRYLVWIWFGDASNDYEELSANVLAGKMHDTDGSVIELQNHDSYIEEAIKVAEVAEEAGVAT